MSIQSEMGCPYKYSGPPLMRPPLGNCKTGRIRRVAARERKAFGHGRIEVFVVLHVSSKLIEISKDYLYANVRPLWNTIVFALHDYNYVKKYMLNAEDFWK